MSSLVAGCLSARRACGDVLRKETLPLEHLKLLGPLGFALIACLFPVDVVIEALVGGIIICLLIAVPSVRKSKDSNKLRFSREDLSPKSSQRRDRRNDTFTAFRREHVSFSNTSLEGQVAELLCRMDIDLATSEKLRVLKNSLSGIFQTSFPSAEVQVIAASNPDCARAFGTAIPEVAVLLTIPPDEMCRMPVLPGREKQRVSSCLRVCIATLVKHGFRFRRSDFSADNPKVIFLADAYQFSIDVYVNSVAPLKFKSLLEHVAQQDPLANDLVLLVRHWARERGLALVAAGYISLSAWMVLALFYVQVASQSHKHSSRLDALGSYLQGASDSTQKQVVASEGEGLRERSCAALFRGFMSFYARDFDWCNEIVSLRVGLRQTRPFRIGQWTRIEDPFDTSKDLSVSFNIESLERVRTELERANGLLERGDCLGEVVEAWRKSEAP